jgi:hypothetical protein
MPLAKLGLQLTSFVDLWFAVGFLVLFLFVGAFLGKKESLLFIFSSYSGWVVFGALPLDFPARQFAGFFNLEMIFFLGVVVVIYLFLSSVNLLKGIRKKNSFLLGALYGALVGGFLLSFMFSLVAPEKLSAIVFFIFGTEAARLGWALAPLGGVSIFH